MGLGLGVGGLWLASHMNVWTVFIFVASFGKAIQLLLRRSVRGSYRYAAFLFYCGAKHFFISVSAKKVVRL